MTKNNTILHALSDRDIASLRKRSRMLTRSAEAADDLLQASFLKALELDQAGKYRGRRDSARVKFVPGQKQAQGSPASFLNGIIGGLCMNMRRMETGRSAILAEIRCNIHARGGRRIKPHKVDY